MKKRILIFTGLSILVGCSQVEQDFTDVNSLSDGDLVEKVIFEVLPIKDGDNLETRASAVPDGGTVSFAWEENDKIGIYPNKGSQIYFTIEDGAGSSSATFDGGGWALKQNASYVSYYPFVADFFLSRDEIPVSFVGQKQIGTSSPFHGARYYLATEPTSSENGVLRFSYKTLNTIINVNATLPAGTYTKMSLTIEEPLFVEEGTYSLDDRTIVGTKFTNTLEIELEDVVLTEDSTIPIYIMSAPVDLKDKEVTVRIISSDGQQYECIKTPSKAYEAGTRYGLTCDEMEEVSIINFADPAVKAICVANWDTDGDGELDMDEAAAVTELPAYGSDNMFNGNTKITSFDELQYFTGLDEIRAGAFSRCSNLVSITLPESITAIRTSAFSICSKLAHIVIPDSVTSIEYYAFMSCSSLTHFDIPEGAVIDWTMLYDTAIESINIPTCTIILNADTPEYETLWFGDCISSISYSGSISIPSNLGIVPLRSSLTTLYFDRSFSLTNDPDYGYVIAGFNNPDNNLSSITVSPDNSLFDSRDNCNSLIKTATNTLLIGAKTSTIPESVKAIAPQAFEGLNYSSPFSITVPASVAIIGGRAFRPHPSSSYSYSVFFLASEPPTLGDDCFGNDTENENLYIYVPSGSVNAYKIADGWSDYANRIQAIPDSPSAIDLGLSVMWASFNIGATKPEEYGDYYAWGELEPRTTFSYDYKWLQSGSWGSTEIQFSKYNDYPSTLKKEDDIANYKWGDPWRMPTFQEQTELRTQCDWSYTEVNGITGWKIQSRANNNSIFLPDAGNDNGLIINGSARGQYWSSTLYYSNASAYCLDCIPPEAGDGDRPVYYSSPMRCSGLSVRAVRD